MRKAWRRRAAYVAVLLVIAALATCLRTETSYYSTTSGKIRRVVVYQFPGRILGQPNIDLLTTSDKVEQTPVSEYLTKHHSDLVGAEDDWVLAASKHGFLGPTGHGFVPAPVTSDEDWFALYESDYTSFLSPVEFARLLRLSLLPHNKDLGLKLWVFPFLDELESTEGRSHKRDLLRAKLGAHWGEVASEDKRGLETPDEQVR